MTCVSVESRVSEVLLQSLRMFFFSNCVELLLCLFSDTAVALWHFKDPDRGEKKLLITPSWIHHSEKAFGDAEPGKGLSESAASHLAALKCPAHDVNVCLWDVLLRNVHRSDLCQTSQHMRWDSNDWTALGLCSTRLQTHAGRHIDSSVLCRLHEKNKSSRYWTFNTRHVEWQRHTKLWIHIQSILRKMHRSHVKLWSEELGDARPEFRCVSVPAPHTWARWGWLQRLEIDLLEQRSFESLYVSGSLSGRRSYCT